MLRLRRSARSCERAYGFLGNVNRCREFLGASTMTTDSCRTSVIARGFSQSVNRRLGFCRRERQLAQHKISARRAHHYFFESNAAAGEGFSGSKLYPHMLVEGVPYARNLEPFVRRPCPYRRRILRRPCCWHSAHVLRRFRLACIPPAYSARVAGCPFRDACRGAFVHDARCGSCFR